MKAAIAWCRIAAKVGAAVAILFLFTAPSIRAQARGGGIRSMRPSGIGTAARAAGRVATPLNPNFAPLYGVPGLGFDYEHLAAISRPSLQRQAGRLRSGRGFVTPIYGFGFPYYYYPYDYDYDSDAYAYPQQYMQQPLPPPQPEVEAPPAEAQAVAPAPAAPVPELGQLILVRKDGQIVMAVAFTTSADKLTYITQDGLRRSFPLSDLDQDATRQMNEVNGTSVSLPD